MVYATTEQVRHEESWPCGRDAFGCEGNSWKAEVPATVLKDPEAILVVFRLDKRRAVHVDKEDLRQALLGAPERDNGRMIGPFCIDLDKKTINGKRTCMQIYTDVYRRK